MKTLKTRGSTMLEVMIAGAVLIVGLTGIVTMLLRSAGETRDGVTQLNASSYANSALEDVVAVGFENIALGTSDAGFTYDAQGRKYGRLVTAVSGGSVEVPKIDVSVRVEWQDSNGVPRVTTATTLISRRLDAGT